MLSDRLKQGSFRLGRMKEMVRQKALSLTDPTPSIPKCMMDYTVSGSDTLERIAASHDCTVGELMKLNRMGSRMVFAGQKILVPVVMNDSDEVFDGSHTTSHASEVAGGQPAADGIRKGPGGAVPAVHRGSLLKTQSAPVKTETVDETDSDCLQRFLKIKVKQVTESDGTVSGTLLVTPNCLMFDPDVSHPLVKENGPDLYGMVANMEDIMCVAVYKDIGSLLGEKSDKEKDIFRPEVDTLRDSRDGESVEGEKEAETVEEEAPNDPINYASGDRPPEDPVQKPVKFSTTLDSDSENEDMQPPRSPRLGSEPQLPSIVEEDKMGSPLIQTPVAEVARKRSISDVSEGSHRSLVSMTSESESTDRPRAHSELQPSQSFGSNAKARSGVQSVAKGAESVAQTAARGTKTVAHGVVTHTKSAADTLQEGAKAAANQAKAAADAVAALPENIVNKGSELIAEGVNGMTELFSVEEQRSPNQLKREQSLATLEGLKQKTLQAREQAVSKAKDVTTFSCATSTDEMPDLFMSVDDMVAKCTPLTPEGDLPEVPPTSPVLPYYMTVRLTRKKKRSARTKSVRGSDHGSISSYDEDCAFGNRLKREFWFAIPRHKADNIYNFLLQWSPEKYGQDVTQSSLDDSTVSIPYNDTSSTRPDRGFIVLDSEADESLTGEKPTAPLFGTSYLNREWEIVTVQEMCRRLSLDQIDHIEMPIPEGASSSQILDELMIRQVMEILPARAEGYPWVNIYNSEKHGFSLSTLYRKMAEFDEDMSPVLLIIRDTNEHVFGAIVSSAIRPQEGYAGTGDSCMLWRFTGEVPHTRELRHYTWTGDNQFFVNASKESLSIGAGGGHYGMWLDADLNHGRSQRCDTFDNEPLAGDKEDFIIQFCEAYGFRM